jgi:hypothetical protein
MRGDRVLRTPYPNELYHYGIRGQKWGVRRFQNPDGTLTSAGKQRYGLPEDDTGKHRRISKGNSVERAFAKYEARSIKFTDKFKEKEEKARSKDQLNKVAKLQETNESFRKDKNEVRRLSDLYYGLDPNSKRKIDAGYRANRRSAVIKSVFSLPFSGAWARNISNAHEKTKGDIRLQAQFQKSAELGKKVSEATLKQIDNYMADESKMNRTADKAVGENIETKIRRSF